MSALTKLAMIAAFAALPLAAAGASGHNTSVRIRINDIDLASASGQKILALRIDRAAHDVCDFANDRLDRKVRTIERKCRKDAKASAWATARRDRRLSNR